MILMNDFKAEPSALREATLEAVERVLDSGWYVLGPEVKRFEQAWATECGVAHGIGVANGMDAIDIGLRAMGIGPGDEVITTCMTAFATTLAIVRAGATPVIADIDPHTGLMSIESAARCISPYTKAVVLVHLYGQVRHINQWLDFCHAHGFRLLEDCAQAHSAEFEGQRAGSFGQAAAFSFYPTKNLGAIGDAGMLVTNSNALAEQACQLRNYGQSVRYHHPVLGMNSRLDELQAAILSTRLQWLSSFTEARQRIASQYSCGIRNPYVQLQAAPVSPRSHVYHLFVVTSPERALLQTHLEKLGVQTHIHYPVPIHFQQSCKGVRRDPQGLQHAERHAQICLSLPCHPQLTEMDVNTVIDAVNAFRA